MSDFNSTLTAAQRSVFRALAASTDGIDVECYARFDRDPLEPLVAHGNPRSPIGFFGRDPGRDEVQHQQIGRASCRESVSQYVSMSEGVGSFNITTSTNHSMFILAYVKLLNGSCTSSSVPTTH